MSHVTIAVYDCSIKAQPGMVEALQISSKGILHVQSGPCESSAESSPLRSSLHVDCQAVDIIAHSSAPAAIPVPCQEHREL